MILPIETDRGPGVTRDISLSGLFMVTDQGLAIGERLQLVLTVPDPDALDALRLSMRGRVVRTEEFEGGAGVGVALDEGTPYLLQAS